ncbi:putative efflux protein, MATE family [Pseudoalteromonas sp. DSM 26666]|uniref:MATE family efflux transporter n=1 Tax=Pseudoalteromonas sp. DSM 26666 TaxID=1761892 RepID=UPI0008F39C3C|nr:MATE family efflux transporter [Pseudoalteromonas sp. DSM 26666]SFT80474.1 putative efflux protein, MATE family [Pseudoalteromonas sp. DSM 26666]
MTPSGQLFLQGSIAKALLKLGIPIILINILQSAYQLTDAFWVGRLGATQVAAVSISTPITFLVIAIGSGLAMAGAILSAQYMGAGQQDKVNHVAAQTVLMVAFTALVLGLLGYVLSPYFLKLLGVEPAVYSDALKFMHVSFIGVIFVFIYAMFQSLMRGIGQTKVPLIIVSTTVLLNFILDPLFIFGYGRFEGLGVMGAALATLVTQSLAALAGIIIFLRGRHGIQLQLKSFYPDWQYMKRAFFLGAPGSIELSTRAFGLIIMSFLVASFGTVTIAAYGVGSNILQMVMIPAMGLSMAVSTLVGQNMGAGNIKRAEQITKLASMWGLIGLSFVGGIAYLYADTLVAFFIPEDNSVINKGAQFVQVMCLSWGGIGVQLCIVAAFRASGNMLNAMIIALLSQCVVQFPAAYILSNHTFLGDQGIWYSFAITNITIALIAFAWFMRGAWKKTRLTKEDKHIVQVTRETLIEEGTR